MSMIPTTPRIADSKVPAITVAFWVVKIAATTLGETGGDALSMTLNVGYLVSTAIFFGLFAILVAAQIRARTYHTALYWAVIVATTTAGTTLADFADRSLGIGYAGGSTILLMLVALTLFVWWRCEGSVAVDRITSQRAEVFYWLTILFSNTLGTALGDWLADSGLGYEGGALVFAAALAAVALAFFVTNISRTALFWSAFILTRPLGATVGDLLTKPHANGGLALGRFESSLAIAAFMAACLLLVPQRAGSHPSTRSA